jgi:hypothetical protein
MNKGFQTLRPFAKPLRSLRFSGFQSPDQSEKPQRTQRLRKETQRIEKEKMKNFHERSEENERN